MEPNLFAHFLAANRARVEVALKERLPLATTAGADRLNEAVRYAVFPGGKRLRPHLTLVASTLAGASEPQAVNLACAIEFIHTSSLILDDLPSMDDAEVRRGRPALHIAFGEGIAILTGVALLNQAYALFAESAETAADAGRLPALFKEATKRVGHQGMVAGQAVELALSGISAEGSVLLSRQLKTTALMRLMLVAGGVICGARQDEVAALATFGECLGRAYQLYDDLHDNLGDHELAGKSVGQDLRHSRPTEVNGLSDEQVRTLAITVLETGKEALKVFAYENAKLLTSAADYIVAGFNRAAAPEAKGVTETAVVSA
jgi:geranylgeranyl pyrophosphate synthase